MQIIQRTKIGQVEVFAIDGGIDRTTHDEFVADMQEIIDAGARQVVLDFSRLTYMNSLSLGTLVRVHQRFKKAGAALKFAELHTNVVAILHFARLDHVFDLYEDIEAAVKSFK